MPTLQELLGSLGGLGANRQMPQMPVTAQTPPFMPPQQAAPPMAPPAPQGPDPFAMLAALGQQQAQPEAPKTKRQQIGMAIGDFLQSIGAGLSNRGKAGQSTGAGAAMQTPFILAQQRQQQAQQQQMMQQAQQKQRYDQMLQGINARTAQQRIGIDQQQENRMGQPQQTPGVNVPFSPEVEAQKLKLNPPAAQAAPRAPITISDGKGGTLEYDFAAKKWNPVAGTGTPKDDVQPLVAAIIANPQLFERLAPTTVEKVTPLLAAQNFPFPKKTEGIGEFTNRQLSIMMQMTNSLKSHPAYTDMQDIATGMGGVETGLAQHNGFGDVTAINSFQRMVDPGATVRSEDVAIINSAAGLARKILSEYPIERLTKGAQLPEAVRQEMMTAAKQLYEKRARNYNDTIGTQYKALAGASKIPYEFIGQDFAVSGPPNAGSWKVISVK